MSNGIIVERGYTANGWVVWIEIESIVGNRATCFNVVAEGPSIFDEEKRIAARHAHRVSLKLAYKFYNDLIGKE